MYVEYIGTFFFPSPPHIHTYIGNFLLQPYRQVSRERRPPHILTFNQSTPRTPLVTPRTTHTNLTHSPREDETKKCAAPPSRSPSPFFSV